MKRSITTGPIETRLVKIGLRLSILWVATRELGSLRQAIRTLIKLIKYRKTFQGDRRAIKFVRSPGGYHLALNAPMWPSPAFFSFIRNELHRIENNHDNHWLLTLIFSVTSKCSLNCEHCFEWNNLSGDEALSLDALKMILANFQKNGIGQVQVSGGEPLQRLDDTLELVRTAQSNSEFWLLSSGIGLTLDVATQLKSAGFLGVNLSLDHWNPEKHNAFRGNDSSFEWVQKAAQNVRHAGMQLAISVCATQEFTSRDNLERYLSLAKSLECGFVQILEPRSAGRYESEQVELHQEHIDILTDFYIEKNTRKENRSFPMVMYPGYHQRRLGCFGAGLRMLHMDPKGNIHACPFCRSPIGNSLDQQLHELIDSTRLEGCHVFEQAEMFRSTVP